MDSNLKKKQTLAIRNKLLQRTFKNWSILIILAMIMTIIGGFVFAIHIFYQPEKRIGAALAAILLVFTFLFAVFVVLLFLFRKNTIGYDGATVSEAIAWANNSDPLTGCRNYSKFLIDAKEILASQKEKQWFILYCDIKNFKYINDAFGYSAGDEILIHISEVMQRYVKERGIFTRVSGDSFVMMKDFVGQDDLDVFFNSFIDEISKASVCVQNKYHMDLSGGIYVVDDCGRCVSEKMNVTGMIDRAIIAQETIKNLSGTRYAVYNEKLREKIHYEKELEQEMVLALETGEFEIYLQPKCDIQKCDAVVGAETLVRWNSHKRGMLYPSEFIPLLEKNGFIVEVDLYVFKLVCDYIRDRIDHCLSIVPISVNVSRVDMYQSNFVSRYTEMKNQYNIPDGLLQLEFTESIAYDNHEDFSNIIKMLHNEGFECSLDDFGKGNSSLNVLKDLPIKVLKLDMLFFRKGEFQERDEAVIASIISLAKVLGMKTVAEGVETTEQVEFLRKIGCDVVQGYVFAKPMPASQMNDYIEEVRGKIESQAEREDLYISGAHLWAESYGNQKYGAALLYVDAIVTEIDLDTGLFYPVTPTANKVITKNNSFDRYDDSIRLTGEHRVHPDDRSEWMSRFSLAGLRAAFYRGEDRISLRFRALDENSKEYLWFDNTILRLKTDQKDQYKAIGFLQNIHLKKWLEMNGGESKLRLADSVLDLYLSIHEINLINMTYKSLETKKGFIPQAGNYNDLFGERLLKIHEEDKAVYSDAFSPEALLRYINNGVESIQFEYRAYIGQHYHWLSRTVMRVKNTPDDRMIVMAFIQDIHERKTMEMERYDKINRLKNVIISTFEEMLEVNLTTDRFEVIGKIEAIKTKPEHSTFSGFFNHLIRNTIHPEDRERADLSFNRESLIQIMGREDVSERIDRFRVIDENGHYHWMRFYVIKDPSSTHDNMIIYLYCKNIDNSMRELEILQNKADYDSLTGLYNRRIFEQLVKERLANPQSDCMHAFLIIDVDDFKRINDTWGHMAGDETLVSLSKKISGCFRSDDIVGRIGGDEFVVFMSDLPSMDSIRKKSEDICRYFSLAVEGESIDGIVTCSVGISVYGIDGHNYEELFKNADTALYRAKANGKNRPQFYHDLENKALS